MFKARLTPVAGVCLLAIVTAMPMPAGAAEDEPVDVHCSDLTLTLNAPDTQAIASYTVTPQTLLQQCRSASGAPLALVAPNGAVTISLEAHTSETRRFVVENTGGEQASAKLTVVRQ